MRVLLRGVPLGVNAASEALPTISKVLTGRPGLLMSKRSIRPFWLTTISSVPSSGANAIFVGRRSVNSSWGTNRASSDAVLRAAGPTLAAASAKSIRTVMAAWRSNMAIPLRVPSAMAASDTEAPPSSIAQRMPRLHPWPEERQN
jgi:hypothetical protein